MTDRTDVIGGDDLELAKCLTILDYRHQLKTVEDIATIYNVSRRTIYNWIAAWQQSGLLDKARGIYFAHKAESIAVAVDLVVEKFPAILDRMAKIALGEIPASPRTSLEAAAWLKSQVVDPRLMVQSGSQSAEEAYAKAQDVIFDPISIGPRTRLSTGKAKFKPLDDETAVH